MTEYNELSSDKLLNFYCIVYKIKEDGWLPGKILSHAHTLTDIPMHTHRHPYAHSQTSLCTLTDNTMPAAYDQV